MLVPSLMHHLVLAIAKIYQYNFTASWTKFGHVRKNQFIDWKSFYLCGSSTTFLESSFINWPKLVRADKFPANINLEELCVCECESVGNVWTLRVQMLPIKVQHDFKFQFCFFFPKDFQHFILGRTRKHIFVLKISTTDWPMCTVHLCKHVYILVFCVHLLLAKYPPTQALS